MQTAYGALADRAKTDCPDEMAAEVHSNLLWHGPARGFGRLPRLINYQGQQGGAFSDRAKRFRATLPEGLWWPGNNADVTTLIPVIDRALCRRCV
jgi:hypothetical protein